VIEGILPILRVLVAEYEDVFRDPEVRQCAIESDFFCMATSAIAKRFSFQYYEVYVRVVV